MQLRLRTVGLLPEVIMTLPQAYICSGKVPLIPSSTGWVVSLKQGLFEAGGWPMKSHEGQAMVALHPAVSPTLHVHRGGMLAAQLGDGGDCLGAAFW
jgi:hypothetical protein